MGGWAPERRVVRSTPTTTQAEKERGPSQHKRRLSPLWLGAVAGCARASSIGRRAAAAALPGFRHHSPSRGVAQAAPSTAAQMALSIIEAARISAIVERRGEKLSFLASITPDVMAHRDELSQIVGDEITRIIQEQRGLETRYEQLIAQRTSLKALSNKTKFNENQDLVKEVARAARVDKGALPKSEGASATPLQHRRQPHQDPDRALQPAGQPRSHQDSDGAQNLLSKRCCASAPSRR